MPAAGGPGFWVSYFTRFECPECWSESGYASRPRSFSEKHILPLLMMRPVRCAACNQRCWRPITVTLMRRREALETN